MARRDTTLDNLFEIAATLPWWAGVGLAVGVFVVLHSLAGTTVTAPTSSAGIGEFAVESSVLAWRRHGTSLWMAPDP